MSTKCPQCQAPVSTSILESAVVCRECGAALRPTRWSMALVLGLSFVIAKICAEAWVRPYVGWAAGVAVDGALFAAVMPAAYWAFARFEAAPKPISLDL